MILKRCFICLVVVLIVGICHPKASTGAEAGTRSRILILHSYHFSYKWTRQVDEGIASVFEFSPMADDIETFIYYMDTKRHHDPVYLDTVVKTLLVHKLSGQTFDLVMTSDDDAFEFVLQNRSRLFPKIPIVFCGVNTLDANRIPPQGGITGVSEEPSFFETLEAALDLQPEVRRVVVVGGTEDVTSRKNREHLLSVIPRLAGRAHFEFWEDPYEELIPKVAQLDKNAMLLYNGVLRDRSDSPVDLISGLEDIRAVSNAPIYSFWEFFIGHGMMGGHLVSGQAQGSAAARMALRILEGESPDAIPIWSAKANVWIFDWKELKRFGISTRELPENSTVINRPEPVFAVHSTLFWSGLVAAMGLITGLGVLLWMARIKLKATRSLRESEDRLSLALAAANAGIWDANLKTEEAYFSPSWFTLLGYPPDAFPHTYETWIQLMHPDDRSGAEAQFKQFVLNRADDYRMEFRMRGQDGRWRWILSVGKAFERDAGGEMLRMVGIHLDITDRKHWEKTLEASERRYRDLFNEAPVMYVITENREGEPVIKDVNNLFLKTLGYSREEVLGLRLADFYTEASVRELLNGGGYQRALEGHFFAEERSFETRDNRTVDTLLHALPERDASGRVIGTRAMYLDITERKRAEKETRRLETALQQSQKMESIGILAGGIAHDFNNILAAVIGYSELVMEDIPEGTTPHANLGEILRAGTRARDLVQQILAFSRQDRRELKLLQVGPLVKETLKLLRSSLPATIDVRQQIEEELCSVLADATQIHQILMNLCTNAAQAMEEKGGVLKVKLGPVELAADDLKLHPGLRPGRYLLLSVQDTGAGMSPEIVKKIFDPYFTTKDKGQGTGLGLAVVHGIVKSYGGAINVYSEPGQGATFNIYLPAADGPEKPKSATEHAVPAARGSERILLIDDEPFLAELGKQMLERLGYQVDVCTGSREALDRFRDEPRSFDLILTDMTMPEMTGDQLAAGMLEIRPDIPIILCTGYSKKLLNRNAGDLGVRAVLMKPLRHAELARTVRKVLDGSIAGGAAGY